MAKRPGVSGGRRPEVPAQGQRAAVAAQTTGERRPLLTTSVGTAGWGGGSDFLPVKGVGAENARFGGGSCRGQIYSVLEDLGKYRLCLDF